MSDDLPPDPEPGDDLDSEKRCDLPPDPELARVPMSAPWKVVVTVATVVAAGAAGSIGAAIIRITCEEACAVPYFAAVSLGVALGGVGMLILGVLVARSMMEWKSTARDREADVVSTEPE